MYARERAKFPAGNEKMKPLSPQEENESKSDNQNSPYIKFCFLLAAWGFVLIRCLLWNPTSILDTPFFPIGLVAWLPNGEEKAIFVWFLGGWIVGWAIY